VCTNRGCIPAKAYIESINLYKRIRNASRFGIEVGQPAISLAALAKRKERIVSRLVKGIELLLKNSAVDLYPATAEIVSPHTIRVGGTTIETANLLIATGSIPRPLPFPAPKLWTSDDVFALEKAPASLIIIGGGVIGCEMAHIFSSLGAKVTVIEALDRVLASEDREASSALVKIMREVDFITGARVCAIDGAGPHRVSVEAPDGARTLEAEHILACIGRTPVLPPGVKELGPDLRENGGLKVDEYMQTTLPHVYAVGDVTGAHMFAYAASKAAEVAVDHVTGGDKRMSFENIPSIVFTDPEIASVGGAYDGCSKGTFPVAALGRARTMEVNEGFANVYADANGRLKRISIMAPHATELIAWAGLAIDLNLSVEEFLHPPYTHPTLSEILKEAAEDLLGVSVHKA
ncbi:MAG TPA: FAD-dependent oxidoreductase, partial [Deltaproteobacteria bacterium]|nr:FAD-dependent oxidoreductase [Deltaproteobacteria bacterium]